VAGEEAVIRGTARERRGVLLLLLAVRCG